MSVGSASAQSLSVALIAPFVAGYLWLDHAAESTSRTTLSCRFWLLRLQEQRSLLLQARRVTNCRDETGEATSHFKI